MPVFINNSEQLRVEHQVLLNRLTAQMQPQQVVGNGIGQLLSGAKKAGARFLAGAGGASKKLIGRNTKSSLAFKAGQGARGAGIQAMRGARRGMNRLNSAGTGTKLALGAGAGAAGTGAVAMSTRKKRQVA